MTYLKHTVLKGESHNGSPGFVFSKWHAMGLALFFVLFFVASYFFQKWMAGSLMDPVLSSVDPVVGSSASAIGSSASAIGSSASANVESFASMRDWFTSSGGPVLPFRKPPVAAAECMNDDNGPWYYKQGVDGTSSHCTEQCPAPTLPDEDGHCRTGLPLA